MKACRVHAFGPPNAIVFEDVPLPQPAAGEVLVRVHAAGVGPWDTWVRSGKSGLPQPLPLTLGADLAGTVEAAGPGAGDFAIGDAVFGCTNPRFVGAYAEFAVASVQMLALAPHTIDFCASASVPVVAVTAVQMIAAADIVGGHRVLVHGASGSVGTYAVQFAHRAGAYVIAATRSDDGAELRRLGADEVVATADFEEALDQVDAVLDTIGGDVQQRSFAVLRPGGHLVSVVSPPDHGEAERRAVTASFFFVDVNRADLQHVAALIDEGAVKTHVGTVLPLAQAVTAHEMIAGLRPHAPGKIVLRVTDTCRSQH